MSYSCRHKACYTWAWNYRYNWIFMCLSLIKGLGQWQMHTFLFWHTNKQCRHRHAYTSLTLPQGMTRKKGYTNLHAWGNSLKLPVLISWLCRNFLKYSSKLLWIFSCWANLSLTFGCLLIQHKMSWLLIFLDCNVAFPKEWFISPLICDILIET